MNPVSEINMQESIAVIQPDDRFLCVFGCQSTDLQELYCYLRAVQQIEVADNDTLTKRQL